MGIIYCLYSTSNGKPRYIGKSTQALGSRYRQHEIDAADGDTKQPLHRWMRKEWLAGHDIRIHEIAYGITEEKLSFHEKGWMRNFEDLLNVRGKYFLGFQEQPAGTQIRQLCEKATAKQIDNCGGYHGVTFYPTEDAYQVTVRWGFEEAFCNWIHVLGDSLPGTDSHRYWFTDMNLAIEARDNMREQLIASGELWRHPEYQWPPDLID